MTEETRDQQRSLPHYFDIFDDGNYEWPNLFEEADEMLQASLLMYLLASLRHVARQGELQDSEKLLQLPMTSIEAYELIQRNVEVLHQRAWGEEVAMCEDALKSMQERYLKLHKKREAQRDDASTRRKALVSSESSILDPLRCALTMEWRNNSPDSEVELKLEPRVDPTTLVAFSDDNSGEQLVYAVAVDSLRKRITVAFRGSVTPRDFVTDVNIQMKTLDNPLYGLPEQQEHIRVHSGFHGYLLEHKQKSGEEAGGCSKFKEIMNEVIPLVESNPDFKLYCTGHSLGGALATLFAFEVGASLMDFGVPAPVTCISVAAPKVGDVCFRNAFQALEEQGKLRCLRIANEKDPVTLSPPMSSKTMLTRMSPLAFSVSSLVRSNNHREIYHHVGMKLKLAKEKGENITYHITHSTGGGNHDRFLMVSLMNINTHYGHEYTHRLLKLKDSLEKLTLNDLYARKDGLQETNKTE